MLYIKHCLWIKLFRDYTNDFKKNQVSRYGIHESFYFSIHHCIIQNHAPKLKLQLHRNVVWCKHFNRGIILKPFWCHQTMQVHSFLLFFSFSNYEKDFHLQITKRFWMYRWFCLNCPRNGVQQLLALLKLRV